jgi:hypothetical protein
VDTEEADVEGTPWMDSMREYGWLRIGGDWRWWRGTGKVKCEELVEVEEAVPGGDVMMGFPDMSKHIDEEVIGVSGVLGVWQLLLMSPDEDIEEELKEAPGGKRPAAIAAAAAAGIWTWRGPLVENGELCGGSIPGKALEALE